MKKLNDVNLRIIRWVTRHVNKKHNIPVDGINFYEIIDAPMKYATQNRGQNLSWPNSRSEEFFIPQLTFTYRDLQIAYIQGIHVKPSSRTIEIVHFAVECRFRRKGLGRAIAESFFDEVNTRYGIQKIIFKENSINSQKDYKTFFPKMGATEIETKGEPNWEWLYVNR